MTATISIDTMTNEDFNISYANIERELERLNSLYESVSDVESDSNFSSSILSKEDSERISSQIEKSYDNIKNDKNFDPFIDELLEEYQVMDTEQRRKIRSLLQRYTAFLWIANINRKKTMKEEYYLKTFLLISIKGDYVDTRDLILLIQYYRDKAKKEGVEIQQILEKVAKLSSKTNRFGMGSMQSLLR